VKKIYKWIDMILTGLVAMVVVAVVEAMSCASACPNRIYDVQLEAINVPGDAVAIERSAYIYANSCTTCELQVVVIHTAIMP
jgi:hypothetical protein